MDNVPVSNLVTGINRQDGQVILENYKVNGEKIFDLAREQVLYPDGETFHFKQINIGEPKYLKEFLDYAKLTYVFRLAASHANSAEMQQHGEKAKLEMYWVHND